MVSNTTAVESSITKVSRLVLEATAERLSSDCLWVERPVSPVVRSRFEFPLQDGHRDISSLLPR